VASLESVLAEAQRIGLIGPGSLEDSIEHSNRFAAAVPVGVCRVVDIGAGGGLPGLVIGACRPEVSLLLVDRRGRACDFLRRSVGSLGWSQRVSVMEADVALLGRVPETAGQFDVVTARGFGPPGLVAELGLPLLRPGGLMIVSVVGGGETWSSEGLAILNARVLTRKDGLVLVEAGVCPSRYPRARRSPRVF